MIPRACKRLAEVDFPIAEEIFEPETATEVHGGTVTRAKASCLCCGAVLPPERVRAQLAEQRGGADPVEHGERVGGACMTAVVTVRPDQPGRHYRLPTKADYAAVRKAHERLAEILCEWERSEKQGLCPVPDEPLLERADDLFGDEGAATAAAVIERDPIGSLQQVLFPEAAAPQPSRRDRRRAGGRRGRQVRLDADPTLDPAGATTLDRVHAAMLPQSSGHAAALRRLLEAEQERGPDFLRLANALSALYPRGSTEKRLLDAMLLAAPR